MKKKIVIGVIILAAAAFAVKMLFFSGGPPQGMGQMPPPVVSLTKAGQKKIVNTREYIGRVVAKDEVDLVPQVQGYLKKKYFTDGQMVNKGDILFLIEPDEYEAEVAQAKADIENAKAALWESEKDLERAKELVGNDFISKSDFDTRLALRDKNLAALEAAKAYLKKVNNNLRHTRIYAPVPGKISDIKITEGNLVGPNMGSLATIVRLDPIYVTYNIASDEFTKLQMEQGKKANKIANWKVKLKFQDGTPYPIEGRQDFYDNKIDETTGTIKVRATFRNYKEVLLPGKLVSVTVFRGKKELKTIVPQAAVLEDMQGKYIYFIDKEGKAQQRRITIAGESETDFIVAEGLEPGEEIILNGINKIMMPGMPVMVAPPEDAAPGQEPAEGEKAHPPAKDGHPTEKASDIKAKNGSEAEEHHSH